jgi:1-acyl-sn-glycerol-3-phosphate acyltransferase
MVLLATAGRPIRFLMVEEVYSQFLINWVFRVLQCIPVRRGKRDARAVRQMLEVLGAGGVVGLFPEGGLNQFRRKEGHLGVGYLALKSGAAVIPASIMWKKPRPLTIVQTLLEPCPAKIAFGQSRDFPRQDRPRKRSMQAVTMLVMRDIARLRRSMSRGEE